MKNRLLMCVCVALGAVLGAGAADGEEKRDAGDERSAPIMHLGELISETVFVLLNN